MNRHYAIATEGSTTRRCWLRPGAAGRFPSSLSNSPAIWAARAAWPPSPPTNWKACKRSTSGSPVWMRPCSARLVSARHNVPFPTSSFSCNNWLTKGKGERDVLDPLPIHLATVRRAHVGHGALARRPYAAGIGPAPLPGRAGHHRAGDRRQRRGEIGLAETVPARVARAAVAAGLSAPDPSAGRGAAEAAGGQAGRVSPPGQ